MQRRKGFTTVELVIVIAVIAILATALIPTFGGLIKSANHNVDVQAANQLTTLVVMHAVNHPINSERDLADAINEGMNDPTYYANLKAKSAQYGYCFWYDYKDPQGARVRVGTVEEIAKIAEERNNSGAVNNSATFDSGLRTDLIDGFVLLGYEGGNDLMDLVNDLESAEGAGAYANALSAINAADSSNAAIAKLQSNANSTVIHNENGVFAPNNNVTSVHIPQGTKKLSNNIFVTDGSELLIAGVTVSVPTNTTVTSGSLVYLKDDSCTVNVNVPAEKLPETIGLSSTVATIVVDNGDTYKQEVYNTTTNMFSRFPIDGSEPITGEVDDSVLLKSYVLSDENAAIKDYLYVDTTNKVIYVSKDKVGEDFEIVAGSFISNSNESTQHGFFKWTITTSDGAETTLPNTSKSISINSNVTNVNVVTMGVAYDYEVKTVKVESLAIAEIGGLKPWRSVSYNDDTRSWALTTQIVLTDGLTHDKLTLDKTITINNNRFTINSDAAGNATLSIGSSLTGNSSNKVIFTSSGTNSVEMTITLLDCGDSAFKVNSNANTQTKYNFKYVVGTTGYAVTLGDLFVPNGVDAVNSDIVLSKDGVNDWLSFTADRAWNTITLNELDGFSSTNGTFSLYIKEKNGQYCAPVVLDVKPGAYNVASAADWAAYKTGNKTGTDIAVIKSFTIDGNDTVDTALQYALNVGAGDVFGNFNVIEVKNFIVKGIYTSNYIISATAGAVIDHVIIIGPDYGSTVVIDNSGSESKGTYVTAIYAANGIETAPVKITNCFLSGFRSPLHAGVGKTVVENTTLHRGNYANLYVDKQANLELNNVTTVQYKANGNVGGGISYKHNCGPTQVLTATNLKQYNFLTQSEIEEIVKSAGGTAASLAQLAGLSLSIDSSDIANVSAVKHTINGKDYYHVGITSLSMPVLPAYSLGDNNPANLDGLNVTYGENTSSSAKLTVTKKYGWFTKKDGIILNVWGLPSSAAATLPSTDIEDHIDEFLMDRGVSEANRTAFITEYKTVLDAAY